MTFSQTGTAPTAGSPVSLAFTPVLGSNPTTSPCAFNAADGAGSTVAVSTVYSATGGSGSVVIPGNTPAAQNLYVTNRSANTVSVYPATSNGGASASATITGLSNAIGVAVDPSGDIFVANNNNASVTEYAPNPSGTVSTPIATIAGANTLIDHPRSVAADASGAIYVLNQRTGNLPTVTVYPAGTNGNVAPSATISTSAGIVNPIGVAIGPGGKIYVLDPGLSTPAQILIYAANPSGSVAGPATTISGPSTGLNSPTAIAVDSSGKIYVTNAPSGNPDSVTVYAANASGDAAPVATINDGSGGYGSSGLVIPLGIALDASGKIFVGNASGTVTSYAANPSGTVTGSPLTTLTVTNPGNIAIH